jgi:hypothetical protein
MSYEKRPGVPWDQMTPRQRDEVWRRSDVLETARHCVATEDNPARPEALKIEARRIFAQCSEILMHSNAPEKPWVLVPLSLRVRDFYTDLWADFLQRLPEEVVEDNTIQVVCGGKAADLVDDDSTSTTFRLESLEAFNEMLKSLETAAQYHLSLVPDDGEDD